MNDPVITKDMTVLEIIRPHKAARDVFRAYDEQAGECVMCNTLFVTVEAVAERYGLDLDRLMADLEKAVGSESG